MVANEIQEVPLPLTAHSWQGFLKFCTIKQKFKVLGEDCVEFEGDTSEKKIPENGRVHRVGWFTSTILDTRLRRCCVVAVAREQDKASKAGAVCLAVLYAAIGVWCVVGGLSMADADRARRGRFVAGIFTLSALSLSLHDSTCGIRWVGSLRLPCSLPSRGCWCSGCYAWQCDRCLCLGGPPPLVFLSHKFSVL